MGLRLGSHVWPCRAVVDLEFCCAEVKRPHSACARVGATSVIHRAPKAEVPEPPGHQRVIEKGPLLQGKTRVTVMHPPLPKPHGLKCFALLGRPLKDGIPFSHISAWGGGLGLRLTVCLDSACMKLLRWRNG